MMTPKMPMKIAATVALLAAASTAGPASALERIRSDQNTCAAVQKTLEQYGELIIRYPSTKVANLILYDHYVASCGYCEPSEHIVPATVPASDNPECGVYRCAPISSGDGVCEPTGPNEPGKPNDGQVDR